MAKMQYKTESIGRDGRVYGAGKNVKLETAIKQAEQIVRNHKLDGIDRFEIRAISNGEIVHTVKVSA